jgi:hypothetical protein
MAPRTSPPQGRGHHNSSTYANGRFYPPCAASQHSLTATTTQRNNNSSGASSFYRDTPLHTSGAFSFSRHNRNTSSISSPTRPPRSRVVSSSISSQCSHRKSEYGDGRRGNPRTPTTFRRHASSNRRSRRRIPTSQGGEKGEPDISNETAKVVSDLRHKSTSTSHYQQQSAGGVASPQLNLSTSREPPASATGKSLLPPKPRQSSNQPVSALQTQSQQPQGQP